VTRRLYYDDSYLRGFGATIVEAAGGRAYLDATAFYPTSGGQPHDLGTINGVPVLNVIDEGDRIAHLVDGPLGPGPAQGEIDWPRRFDFMQQHTGQHLLSAAIARLYSIPTVSVHFGAESSTIDLGTPALTTAQTAAIEDEANRTVFQNRPVRVSYRDAAEAQDLRKASPRVGTLRIVTIEDYDVSACGGTHVRSTAEIGPVLIRKLDKMRGNVRLEFVCGLRAIAAMRAAESSLAAQLAAQTARAAALDKDRRRLAEALAVREGRELHAATEPNRRGRRVRVTRTSGPMPEEARARANAFISEGHAVWIEFFTDPPALLLAVSPDTGLHAGHLLKPLLAEAGAKGGGSATMAQGGLTPECELRLVGLVS
jgi:alanyl-tRNA synthetase